MLNYQMVDGLSCDISHDKRMVEKPILKWWCRISPPFTVWSKTHRFYGNHPLQGVAMPIWF